MSEKQNIAEYLFNSGFNCTQAVLTAFAEDVDLPKNLALNISLGFGGGMGRLQETCGAVIAAYIISSLYCSIKFEDSNERKEKVVEMIQKFNADFINIFKSTVCRNLLDCDLNTEEGKLNYHNNNLRKNVCMNCVNKSIEIIEKMISV